MCPMSGDQLADGLIPARGLEGGRVGQVGEDEGEDARAAGRVPHVGRVGGFSCRHDWQPTGAV